MMSKKHISLVSLNCWLWNGSQLYTVQNFLSHYTLLIQLYGMELAYTQQTSRKSREASQERYMEYVCKCKPVYMCF